MSQADWNKLRSWLHTVFPAATAAEHYTHHIEDARKRGLELPRDEGAR